MLKKDLFIFSVISLSSAIACAASKICSKEQEAATLPKNTTSSVASHVGRRKGLAKTLNWEPPGSKECLGVISNPKTETWKLTLRLAQLVKLVREQY